VDPAVEGARVTRAASDSKRPRSHEREEVRLLPSTPPHPHMRQNPCLAPAAVVPHPVRRQESREAWPEVYSAPLRERDGTHAAPPPRKQARLPQERSSHYLRRLEKDILACCDGPLPPSVPVEEALRGVIAPRAHR